MKLSAVIIARNAEAIIQDCLESVSFCDEIVVVDNNSTDETKKIAEKAGAHVFVIKEQDFSRQRTIGLEKAKGEWILYVDTDERVTPLLRDAILQRVNSLENRYVASKMQRKNFYLGHHEWPKIEQLERLFQKEKLKGWHGELHESPVIDGPVDVLTGFLEHYTHRDLTSMLEKTIIWSGVEAKLRFESHHPKMTWWRFPRVMMSAFWDSYVVQGGWQLATVGLIESTYQAFSIFITYAKLWEMQNNGKIKN